MSRLRTAVPLGMALLPLIASSPLSAQTGTPQPPEAPVAPAAGETPAGAGGQEGPAVGATQADATSAGLGDIIVTAQRRAESVQRVPISITAVTGDALAKSGVTTLDGLQRVAPGVSISTVGSGFVSYTYIRGGGTNQVDPGSDPSVAFFVDEVYIGGTAGLQFDLFDVERVEVLKGPQGTLFGRNASSGAISVVTRRPSSELGANLLLEGTEYDGLLARGSLSGPVSSDGRLLARVSAVYRRRDAFTQNLTGGRDPGNIDTGGARAQVEFKGGDLDVLLTGDWLRARNGMTNQFQAAANVASYVNPALPQPAGRSFYRQYYDVDGFENQDVYDLTGRIEWRTPIGAVTSISAYRNNRFRRLQDQDATIYQSFTFPSSERDRTFSQELRLSGDAFDRVRYVAGLYYYHADIDATLQAIAGPAFPAPPVRGRTATDTDRLTTDSYAAFGQVVLAVNDRIDLTLGGRYTRDDKASQRTVQNFLGAPFSVNPKPSFESFDPAVTLAFRPREGILTYASYREGFKSGGFQSVLPPTAAIAATPFLPEKVRSYEVGVKSTLLDRRLQANVAVFRSDIDNQQIGRFAGSTTVIIDNAGATRADGVDVSLVMRPAPQLTFSADFTAQRARFRRFVNGAQDYAGNAQVRSPDFAGHFSAEYYVDIASLGRFTALGEYSFKSKTFYDGANSRLPGLYQPDYGVGNVRLTFTPRSSPLEVSAFVRNVGDARYFQNIAVSGLSGLATPSEPRVFGGSLAYVWR